MKRLLTLFALLITAASFAQTQQGSQFQRTIPKPLEYYWGKTVGGRTVPYASTTEANTLVPITRRYLGLEVPIGTDSTSWAVYSWEGGIADNKLVIKSTGGGSGSVTTISGLNTTGITWSITNPTTTPSLSLSLTKAAVGLSQVDNTSDANKPVSTAQAAADAVVQAYAVQRANHTGSQAATTITQDATHRFVTDAEKTTWNAGGGGGAVAVPFAALVGDTIDYDDIEHKTLTLTKDSTLYTVNFPNGQGRILNVYQNGLGPWILRIDNVPVNISRVGTSEVTLINVNGVMHYYPQYGISATGQTQLQIPTLTATTISDTSIRLNWTNVRSENSYLTQMSTDSVTWATIRTATYNDTVYLKQGLTAATLYYFRNKAIGDSITYFNSFNSVTSRMTAIPSGPVLFDMHLAGPTITESPTNVYTSSAGTYAGLALSSPSVVMNSGDSGYVSTYIAASDADNFFFGFTHLSSPTAYADIDAGMFISGGSIRSVNSGGFGGIVGTATTGHYVRTRRIGSVYTLEDSPNGSTWTLLDTLTYTGTGTMRPVAFLGGTGKLYLSQGYNLH